jgi:hypothetical protein
MSNKRKFSIQVIIQDFSANEKITSTDLYVSNNNYPCSDKSLPVSRSSAQSGVSRTQQGFYWVYIQRERVLMDREKVNRVFM